MKFGFGIDVGGTTVKLAYFNEEGTMLDKWEIPTVTANSGAQILPDIAASLEAYLEKNNIAREDILGIGIGVPGPVSDEGVVNKCSNLFWDVFNINETLSSLTGFPVKAGNDATVAALGECWKGGGKGCRNMFLATLGTGVGGGLVIGGTVTLGTHGAAGEVGHMVLCRDEKEPCNCGKYGCVEQYCSATGVVRLANRRMAEDDMPSSLRSIQALACKDVFDAAAAADALALEVLDRFYRYLGEFIANVCNVTNPEVVVLGGGVSKAGQPLLDGAKRYFDRFVFHANSQVRFALADLGNDAGAYGAFKLALDAFGR